MATAGLQQGAITIQESNLVCGGGITIGNKFTRCMGGNHGSPNVHFAIEHSCDGYFYRLGLKMKLEGIQAMVDEFDLNVFADFFQVAVAPQFPGVGRC